MPTTHVKIMCFAKKPKSGTLPRLLSRPQMPLRKKLLAGADEGMESTNETDWTPSI